MVEKGERPNTVRNAVRRINASVQHRCVFVADDLNVYALNFDTLAKEVFKTISIQAIQQHGVYPTYKNRFTTAEDPKIFVPRSKNDDFMHSTTAFDSELCKTVTLKFISSEEKFKEKVESHKKVNECEYFRTMFDYFQPTETENGCIELEKETSTLQNAFLDKLETRWIVECIAKALTYLHSIGMVMVELIPEKILKYNEIWKFSDISQSVPDKSFVTICLPAQSCPPEVAKTGEVLHKDGKLSFKTTARPSIDVWQFGILIYELVTKKSPFEDMTEMEILKSLTSPEEIKITSEDIRDVSIRTMLINVLVKDPEKRWTMKQIIHHLKETGSFCYHFKVKPDLSLKRFPILQRTQRVNAKTLPYTEKDILRYKFQVAKKGEINTIATLGDALIVAFMRKTEGKICLYSIPNNGLNLGCIPGHEDQEKVWDWPQPKLTFVETEELNVFHIILTYINNILEF